MGSIFSLNYGGGTIFRTEHVIQPPVLSTWPLHTNRGGGKERRILMVHGDLPRQHSFGATLRFTGPVPADSRQLTPSVRICVTP